MRSNASIPWLILISWFWGAFWESEMKRRSIRIYMEMCPCDWNACETWNGDGDQWDFSHTNSFSDFCALCLITCIKLLVCRIRKSQHETKQHLLRGQQYVGEKRFWEREKMISVRPKTSINIFEWERSHLWSWSINFDCLFLPIVFQSGMKLAPPFHDTRTTFQSWVKFQSGMNSFRNHVNR